MKKFIFFLIFLSLLYSYTFYYSSSNSDLWITSDLTFSNSFTLSASDPTKVISADDPENLQDNDIICPMIVEVYPEISGEWGGNFEAQSHHPSYGDFASYTQVKKYAVSWMGITDLETVIDSEDTIFSDDMLWSYKTNEQSWYNTLAALVTHPQPVNFKKKLSESGFPYEDKKGLVDVLCDGEYVVKVGNSEKDSGDITTISFLEVNLQSAGSHKISTSINDGHCIAALKAPVSSSDTIYLFRENSYSIPKKETSKTIKVQAEAVIDLTLDSGSVKDINGNSPPFEFPGTVQIVFSVTNEGDLPVKFNGENTITSGFSVQDLNGDGKWDLFNANGWSYISYSTFTIDPGETKKIGFVVQYPGEDLPNNLNKIIIELGYESEKESPCSKQKLGSVLEFNIQIKEKIPIPDPKNYNCTITPSSKLDMTLNDDYDFVLKCYFKGQLTTCDGIDWSLTPQAWDLTEYVLNPTQATVTPTTLTTGKLKADVVIDTVDLSCSANLKANSTGEIPPVTSNYNCTITPSSKLDMDLNSYNDFTLKCYFKNQETTCDSVDWDLDPNFWNLVTNPTKATVQPTTINSGELIADVVIDNMEASCSANLKSVPPGAVQGYSCVITPPSKSDMAVGKNYDFTLGCYKKGLPINCNSVDWSLTPQAWDLTEYADPLKARVTPSSITSGQLTADVLIESTDTSCFANLLSISNYTAEIDPSENLDMTINVSYPFTLKCYNWGTQIQCGQVSWALFPPGWKLDKFPAPFPLVFVTPLSPGDGTLSALVIYPDGGAADSAPLEAAVVDNCVLNMKKIGLGGAEFDFDLNDGVPEDTQLKTYIKCTEDGLEVPCNNVQWFTEGGSEGESTNTYLFVKSGGADDDLLSIVANAQVASGPLICSISTDIVHPTSCEISEEFFVDGFDDFNFRVKCFEGKTEIDCGKIGTGQLDYELDLYSGDLQLLVDHHYTEEPDHISVKDAPDEYWLFVEIKNYLINYINGVNYELTVTIPAVGAERPTTCSKDGEIGNLLCEFFI